MMAWDMVASLLVTEPSPRPINPWFVYTLQNTQFTLPTLTTNVLIPVIFKLSDFAGLTDSAMAAATGAAAARRKCLRFIAHYCFTVVVALWGGTEKQGLQFSSEKT